MAARFESVYSHGREGRSGFIKVALMQKETTSPELIGKEFGFGSLSTEDSDCFDHCDCIVKADSLSLFPQLSKREVKKAEDLVEALKELYIKLEHEMPMFNLKEFRSRKIACLLGSTESSPLLQRRGSKLTFTALACLNA